MSHPDPLCPAHNTDNIIVGCRCNFYTEPAPKPSPPESDDLPIVVRVIEGDAPLDVDARTIGWESLREGDWYRNLNWPTSEPWYPAPSPDRAWRAVAVGCVVASVQPRPAPELTVGRGVRRNGPGPGTALGWVVEIDADDPERFRFLDSASGLWHWDRLGKYVELVPPEEMPPYAPPPGIEADAPPEVVDQFRIYGADVTGKMFRQDQHEWMTRWHGAQARKAGR